MDNPLIEALITYLRTWPSPDARSVYGISTCAEESSVSASPGTRSYISGVRAWRRWRHATGRRASSPVVRRSIYAGTDDAAARGEKGCVERIVLLAVDEDIAIRNQGVERPWARRCCSEIHSQPLWPLCSRRRVRRWQYVLLFLQVRCSGQTGYGVCIAKLPCQERGLSQVTTAAHALRAT